MLELFHHQTAICAKKVRLVLEEKSLPWQGHLVDIFAGEQLTPGYLAINPNGVVPTLREGGATILESSIINEYLEDAYPKRPLRPGAAAERADMRLLVRQMDEQVHPAVAVLTFAISTRDILLSKSPQALTQHLDAIREPARRERQEQAIRLGLDAPLVSQALHTLDRFLGAMNDRLAKRAWLCSDEPSLADITLAPYVLQLELLRLQALWEPARPGLPDWFTRMRARPSWNAAVTRFNLAWRVEQMNAAGDKAAKVLAARMPETGARAG